MQIPLASLLVALSLAEGHSDVQTISMTTVEQPNGLVEVSIKNESGKPATAFVIVGEYTSIAEGVHRATSVRYTDSVFNSDDRSLLRGEMRSFNFGATGPGGTPVVRTDVALKAAIFEDGSVLGDPEWADRLVQGRRFLYRHTNAALDALYEARGTGRADADVLRQFQDAQTAAMSASHGDREERRAIETVYETVRGNLERTEMPDGSAAPLDVRIDAVRGVLIQIRQRLIVSKPDVTAAAAAP